MIEAVQKTGLCRTEGAESVHCIDSAKALDFINLDTDLYREICSMFLVDAPDQLRDIHKALQEADTKTLLLKSHTLRSSSGSVGAETMQKIAGSIEEAVRRKDIMVLPKLVSCLQAESEKVFAELRRMVDDTGQ